MPRAVACVDESDHHTLMYVRQGQTVREEGVDERSARRPLRASRGSYDAAAGDIEIDPQCCCFRRSQTNFTLQAVVERRAAVAKQIAVLLRWHSEGSEVRRSFKPEFKISSS